MTRYIFFFLFALIHAAYANVSTPSSAAPLALFQLYSSDAEPVISQALAEQGAGDKVAATISGYAPHSPLISHSQPIEVEIHGLRFDERTKRWNANLLAVTKEDVVSAVPISGRFEEVITLPVLRRQLRNGDTIHEDDIEMEDFAVSRIRGEVVTEAEELIGQVPVRTLSSSRPIRTHEITGPILVEKNSMVQVKYAIPGMEISSSGVALEDGSKGSMVAVRNPDSKKTIHGIVTAKNSITIPTPQRTRNVQAMRQKGSHHATN